MISGHCRIGARSFIGLNATLRDFTTIGSDCFIAMDASVTKDMPDGAVALGAPAHDSRGRRQSCALAQAQVFRNLKTRSLRRDLNIDHLYTCRTQSNTTQSR